jgi:hypothetical protein
MEPCGLVTDSEFERAFKRWNVIGADDESDGAGLAGDALDEAALLQKDEYGSGVFPSWMAGWG